MAEEPFKIILCERGKKAVFTAAEHGAAATATFVYRHAALIGLEMQAARTVWVSTEQPTADLIGERFDEIRRLCRREDIERYVRPSSYQDGQAFWDRSVRAAALEIMAELLPTCPKKSVERMARRRNKGKRTP